MRTVSGAVRVRWAWRVVGWVAWRVTSFQANRNGDAGGRPPRQRLRSLDHDDAAPVVHGERRLLEERERQEAVDLRERVREPARVERRDEVDPAPAGHRRLPGRAAVVAERRDPSETGDGDPAHLLSLDG